MLINEESFDIRRELLKYLISILNIYSTYMNTVFVFSSWIIKIGNTILAHCLVVYWGYQFFFLQMEGV